MASKAYGAGWRAGKCGTSHTRNPYYGTKRLISAWLWDNGWHDGMTIKLNEWLVKYKNNLSAYKITIIKE